MPRKHKVSRYRLRAMFAKGKSPTEIAKIFNVRVETVWRISREEGVRKFTPRRDTAAIPLAPTALAPPSRAAVALAEFDPIVARALAQRRGQQDVPTDPSCASRQDGAD